MKKTTNKLHRETDKCRVSYSQTSKCIVEIMYAAIKITLHKCSPKRSNIKTIEDFTYNSGQYFDIEEG